MAIESRDAAATNGGFSVKSFNNQLNTTLNRCKICTIQATSRLDDLTSGIEGQKLQSMTNLPKGKGGGVKELIEKLATQAYWDSDACK